MKNYLILLLIGAIVSKTKAQSLFMQDVNGTPIKTNVYADVKGTPYLTEDWMKSEVTAADGKVFGPLDIKLDLISNQLIFKGKDGIAMSFTQDIPTFKILNSDTAIPASVFKKGLSSSKGLSPANYVQILVDGPMTLLKKTGKIITESREYNSATVEKTISSTTNFYVKSENGEVVPLQTDKKSLIKLFGTKGEKMKTYIEEGKLNSKEESDLIKIFIHYNAL
ncbi:hypothetical protein ACJVDH_12230 [Pedobacter sp. AW1-32]|uniref:hypothetical protein n=1 Tax=Pedobacter sp. AW1-32 TaxID=3383026 RepID=UPI003FEFC15B